MTELRRVSPEEASQLIADECFSYLDVRTEAEFAAGHPQGAHNVPYMFSGAGGMVKNPDFVANVLGLYAKDAALVIGCKSGGRSLKAANEMLAAGFTRIVDQRAGFDGARNSFGQVTEPGWSQKSLPTETVTPGGSYAELKAKL